jgi:hypothetical protein
MAGSLVAMVAAAPSASAAGGHPTDPIEAWVQSAPPGFAQSQNLLMQFNGWLAQQPAIYDAGYVGSIDDAANRNVTLLWNGSNSVPDPVIAKAKAAGINLATRSWPLSHAQIESASQALDNVTGAFYSSSDFKLADIVGLDPDFRGLTVEGDFGSAVSDIAAATAELARRAQTLVGVRVRVVTGVAAAPAVGRDNDFPPFNAGGYMIDPQGGTCSSGFAIKIKATKVTTARHCAASRYTGRASTYSYTAGHCAVSNPGAARFCHGTSEGYAWGGAYNDVNYNHPVVGYSDVSLGDGICTDGGNSGAHCHVKVTDLMVRWNDGTGNGSVETIKGVERRSGIAVIQGDSGGPVLVPMGGGYPSNIGAAGMIQAVDGTPMYGSSCGPVYDAGNNICTTAVLFTSMRTIVNGIPGASLVTAG